MKKTWVITFKNETPLVGFYIIDGLSKKIVSGMFNKKYPEMKIVDVVEISKLV